jgi:hypothetical protein
MLAKPRAYVETSVISYLTALPSRDIVLGAHQEITREWWANRDNLELFVSQFVIDEASEGDKNAAKRRLTALQEASLLDVTEDAIVLADNLIIKGGLPAKSRLDALHIAIATVNGLDYLVTWNCKHIANAFLRIRIEDICREIGFEPPLICTPLELVKEP